MAKKSDTIEIPNLADDPDYGPAMQLLGAFERKLQEISDELTRHEIEEHLRRDAKGERAAQLKSRLARLPAKVLGLAPTAIAAADVPPEVVRGIALIRGDAPDAADRESVQKLRHDREIIAAAIGAQTKIVNAIKETKSLELCQRLREQHRAALVRIFRAAQELSMATQAERSMRATMILAGYQDMPHVLPPPALGASIALGAEADVDSQISFFRRRLEANGVL